MIGQISLSARCLFIYHVYILIMHYANTLAPYFLGKYHSYSFSMSYSQQTIIFAGIRKYGILLWSSELAGGLPVSIRAILEAAIHRTRLTSLSRWYATVQVTALLTHLGMCPPYQFTPSPSWPTNYSVYVTVLSDNVKVLTYVHIAWKPSGPPPCTCYGSPIPPGTAK